MTKTSESFNEKVREVIKKTLVNDPLITQSSLLDHLNHTLNRSFSRRYVKRMTEDVLIRGRMEAKNEDLKQRVFEVSETFRMTRKTLFDIVLWEPGVSNLRAPTVREVIKACNMLVKMDLKILDAQLAAGLLKKTKEE
jgi:hypothetical protein